MQTYELCCTFVHYFKEDSFCLGKLVRCKLYVTLKGQGLTCVVFSTSLHCTPSFSYTSEYLK